MENAVSFAEELERLNFGAWKLPVVILLSFFLTAPAWGQEKTWEKEWEKTLRLAENEGRLVVAVLRGDHREEAVQTFQNRYSRIRLATTALAVSDFAARIMAERRAGKYLWDICICGTTTPYRVFLQGKALDPIKPLLMLPDVLDESRWWGGRHHYVDPDGKYIFMFMGNVVGSIVSFNSQLVNPREFKSYRDFIDPRWKGKIVVRDPRAPGAGAGSMRWLYYNRKLGTEFIRRLFMEMDVTLSRDDFQALDWLAKGKSAMCFFCRDDQVRKANSQGLPVDSFQSSRWQEGAPINASFGTLSLLNKAPHPNAAKVFVNWFLAREGQKAFQEVMNRPPTTAESLRVDISKEMIPPEERRVDGVEYLMVERPDWMDMTPIYQLVNEALLQAGKR